MQEDPLTIVERKIWIVDDLSKQTTELVIKARQLHEDAQKNIPDFSGDWSEDGVRKFFEKFKKSIQDPLRHKNQKVLEDIGVQTKGIVEEIFDDSKSIDEVARLFNDIKEFDATIASILIKREFLSEWLRDGTEKAKRSLQEILNAKPVFKRIVGSNIKQEIKDILIEKSITDFRFLTSIDDVLLKLSVITNYGISIEENKIDFSKFQSDLETIWQKFRILEDEYKISEEEVRAVVNGKPFYDAYESLKRCVEEYSKKKRALLEDWKMYSAAIKSTDFKPQEFAGGLHQLEEEVERLKNECMSTLGEGGLGILKFLKGEGDFPSNISESDCKKVLEVLRPVFAKLLREMD